MHAVVNGYTISTQVVDEKTLEKPFESWFVEEIRRVKYDSKAMNIIHSFLNYDKFSRCLHNDKGDVGFHSSKSWRYSES